MSTVSGCGGIEGRYQIRVWIGIQHGEYLKTVTSGLSENDIVPIPEWVLGGVDDVLGVNLAIHDRRKSVWEKRVPSKQVEDRHTKGKD